MVMFNIDRPGLDVEQFLEFWRMRRSTEKDNANMEISMVEVTRPLPKLKDIPESVVVQVPTAAPFKTIAPGGELALYAPAKQKTEKVDTQCFDVMHEPVQKKAKTSA